MTGEERGMLPYVMVENYVKAKKCSRLECFTFIDESDAIRCAIGFFLLEVCIFFFGNILIYIQICTERLRSSRHRNVW